MPATHESVHVHPTAIVDDTAELGASVSIGPGALVGPRCRIGDHTILGPYAIVHEHATIGSHNYIHGGAILGDDPQDRAFDRAVDPGHLFIGDHNIIREFVTIHRGAGESGPTRIGSHCFIMANAHVGHNCNVADHVVLTNHTVVGGHAKIGRNAVLSAFSAVHQFCEVGEFAMFQATAVSSQHVPPYCIVHRSGNQLSGINAIGLRRSGEFTRDEISEVREVYRLIFRSSSVPSSALQRTSGREWGAPARRLIEFIESVGQLSGRHARGICTGAARSLRAVRDHSDSSS